ncbi:MAG: TIR domain-containing protein [Vulcanimicrobiota bacterium]
MKILILAQDTRDLLAGELRELAEKRAISLEVSQCSEIPSCSQALEQDLILLADLRAGVIRHSKLVESIWMHCDDQRRPHPAFITFGKDDTSLQHHKLYTGVVEMGTTPNGQPDIEKALAAAASWRYYRHKYRYDVALSFRGTQRAKANQLRHELERRGIRVFYDENEHIDIWGTQRTIPGRYWASRYTVVLISDDYLTSVHCEAEWTVARDQQRLQRDFILAIQIDENLPKGASHWLYYTKWSLGPRLLAESIAEKLDKAVLEEAGGGEVVIWHQEELLEDAKSLKAMLQGVGLSVALARDAPVPTGDLKSRLHHDRQRNVEVILCGKADREGSPANTFRERSRRSGNRRVIPVLLHDATTDHLFDGSETSGSEMVVPNYIDFERDPSPFDDLVRAVVDSYDIFVSYPFSASEAIHPIVNLLREEGLKVFWCRDIPPGTDYARELTTGFWLSRSVLFAINERTPESQHGQLPELAVALHRLRTEPAFKLFPLLLPGAKLEDLPHAKDVKSIMFVDLRSKSETVQKDSVSEGARTAQVASSVANNAGSDVQSPLGAWEREQLGPLLQVLHRLRDDR